jgi:hypothetical protein
MEDKIFYVSIRLSKYSCTFNEKDFFYKRTNNGFVVDKESNFGSKTTRVRSHEILKICSKLRSDIYSAIQFYTWCFEKDLPTVKMLLTEEAGKKLTDIKLTYELMSEQWKPLATNS